MRAIAQDFRSALRGLHRSPAVTCAATASLALGIGATAALFSIVDALDFRPLPYHDATQLVMLRQTPPPTITWCRDCGTSFPTYVDWRAQTTSYSAIAAQRQYMRRWWHDDPGGGSTEFVATSDVSPDFLRLLGIGPSLGRSIGTADAAPGAEHVAILADDFWRREFHADPAAIGKQITFIPFGTERRVSYTIVGVMPRGFRFLDSEMWMPLVPDQGATRADHSLAVIARLKPGIPVARANSEIATIADREALEYPATNRAWRAHVVPLRAALRSDFGQVGSGRFLLLGLVATMLLIASANVATLLLARAQRQYMEYAVRRALGASSLRLATQSVLESVLLTTAGCAIGILIAIAIVPALGHGFGLSLVGITPSIDGRVVGFALLTTGVVTLLCATVPARRATRVSMASVLREHALAFPGIRRATLERALVTVEVAAALVAVTSTAILTRELSRLEHRDLGFDMHALYHITARMAPTWASDSARRREFAGLAIERIGHVPGVRQISLFAPALTRPAVAVEGMPPISGDARLQAVSVGPEFFATMRIPVIAGRGLTDADRASGLPVAVVNEAMAASYWAGRDPVGSQVRLGDSATGLWVRVVGVVPDAKFLTSLASPAEPVIYRPFDQAPEQQVIVVARTTRESTTMESALHRALQTITTSPIDQIDVRPMGRLIEQQLGQQRFNQLLLTAFAILGLVLAQVGVFGTVAYSVSQRSSELGIRTALGARSAHLLLLVSREGLLAAILGVAIGVPASLALGRVVQSLVVGAKSSDPVIVLVSTAAVFALVALSAYASALRATRTDPCIALRGDL